MAMSAGVEGTFRLGDVFSKAFRVFGRHVVAFFPPRCSCQSSGLSRAVGGPAVGDAKPNCSLHLDRFVGNLFGRASDDDLLGGRNGAVTYGVVQVLRGRTMSIAQAGAIAVRRFLPLIGVAILVGLLFWLGIVLLIVPGLIVYAMYYVAAPVCIAEQAGVGASLSRS
jgi:hypothetical protein